MAKTNVGLPQGTRDFGAETVRKRQYIISTIRKELENHGFGPLETPAMENLSTLMGKYGEEGDKLIFKVLNNGLDNPAKHEPARQAFEKALNGKHVSELTERALRYDLTIPFARYVAMNHGQMVFPFKRYQVQPVWRADRPQKGRYREFYQFDADIVGSHGLLNEAELVGIYKLVFAALGISATVKMNSRKLLAALAELCGGAEKLVPITNAIDKIDKIGMEKVKEELSSNGIEPSQVQKVEEYLAIKGSNDVVMTQARSLLGDSELVAKGLAELAFVLELQGKATDALVDLAIDLSLARGLDYYTGLIFEVKANGVNMGSIGGGGRYDDLTGLFGVAGIPGVGISFGIDRIYDVLEEQSLFPQNLSGPSSKLLFFNLGDAESKTAFALAQTLRENGIACELYPDLVKMDKQFKYAEKKGIGHVAILGSKELAEQTVTLKDLVLGKQISLPFEQLVAWAKATL